MDAPSEETCKNCSQKLEDCLDEGLTCSQCSRSVHLRCFKQGAIPDALHGDLFFKFTCDECSHSGGTEIFVREKMSWLQVLVLVFYHLQHRSPGLGRKGYFHWRNHVASLIDKNWDTLFPKDFKRKKKWVGTIAGTLSHFSNFFFKSGTAVVNEPAWWALSYPKLSPKTITKIYAEYTNQKQKLKTQEERPTNVAVFQRTLHNLVTNDSLLTPYLNFDPTTMARMTGGEEEPSSSNQAPSSDEDMTDGARQTDMFSKQDTILPTLEVMSRRLKSCPSLQKLGNEMIFPSTSSSTVASGSYYAATTISELSFNGNNSRSRPLLKSKRNRYQPANGNNTVGSRNSGASTASKSQLRGTLNHIVDPLYWYHSHMSSAGNAYPLDVPAPPARLLSKIQVEHTKSPYSGVTLKPYIRRDTETMSTWCQIMSELQLTVHHEEPNYELPLRHPVDYAFVQPQHIPVINSMCCQFFWPGINMDLALQYPEYSCVAFYGKLIVGFAFMLPNTGSKENYLSFIFVRPGWRRSRIAQFMLYHLCMVSPENDITLHVPVQSSATILFNSFGFKVQHRVKNFYDKYMRYRTRESKDAFYCRMPGTRIFSSPERFAKGRLDPWPLLSLVSKQKQEAKNCKNPNTSDLSENSVDRKKSSGLVSGKFEERPRENAQQKKDIFIDERCHFNTAMKSSYKVLGYEEQDTTKGFFSPYSKMFLKPYIRRDTETMSTWCELMVELQLTVHHEEPNYELPLRHPVDYVYVRAEHIPAISSLCNQFFWTGVNMEPVLKYPDYSCVVMYGRLVIGFAFIVPSVNHSENYISYMLVRPGWRGKGIGRFMLYHLIQMSKGKDLTLHVSKNNPALLLYQKFGFKIESVVKGFYANYLRRDSKECKDAFYCRLEW